MGHMTIEIPERQVNWNYYFARLYTAVKRARAGKPKTETMTWEDFQNVIEKMASEMGVSGFSFIEYNKDGEVVDD